MIEIDGSYGEGGGQILRSALALSTMTGTPFRVHSIRLGRGKAGLLRQHLACVRAAAEISQATVDGDSLGSTTLTFRPRSVRSGAYQFAVGSAGSASLVLQTVLIPLLRSPGPTSVRIEGGTHNAAAPPFDFLDRVFLHVLRNGGVQIDLRLERAGFYPAGGGVLVGSWAGGARLAPLQLLQRSAVTVGARILLANLPRSIARREADVLFEALGLERASVTIDVVDAAGPGNVVLAFAQHEGQVLELVAGFGEKGVRAEEVARGAAEGMKAYLSSSAPVGEHLADQLILPMVFGAGGAFRATVASSHLRTQCWVIERFVGPVVRLIDKSNGAVFVEIDAVR